MNAFLNFFRPQWVQGARLNASDVLSAPFLRLAVITASAGTVAYFLGAKFDMISSTTAAITAVVSVRHTFHESVQESFRQVLGVLIGGVVAYSAMKLIGFNSVVVLIAIFSCFVAARLLRLGEEGAIALVVTTILVVGPHVTTESIESRFYGVVLGVALAAGGSYFVRPGSPQARALKASNESAHRLARLLEDIAQAIYASDGTVDVQQAMKWLAKAEFIANEIDVTMKSATSAYESSNWSPAINRKEAAAVLAQVRLTEATAETVRNICRELLLTSGNSQRLPEMLARALSGVLRATAGVIDDQATIAQITPAERLADEDLEWRSSRDQAVASLRSLDDTQPLLIGGSILRDAEKITDILS